MAETSASGAAGPSGDTEGSIYPLTVLYCEVCGFPPEYCEFGSHLTKCKAWLEEKDPALFERFYGEGIDLKKASKQFATKFATGASVSKNPQGLDEIVVQGDVTDEIVEMLEGNVGVLKGVPEDNIVCVEDKKKKGAAEQS
ncbi:6806_t:CDS:2 [Acaulospora colombiana]|uniref:6806_t:CDS:1 n=1 Tax=Acaulospora colombiana TaxID=27376 RepID=A0ACA9M212_9GLOM|nr:6806_t:CDS:2 [Acaulospora colombiana]